MIERLLAVAGSIATVMTLCAVLYLLVRNPRLRQSDGRVLALGVIIPFVVVLAFVGVLLVVA